MTKKIVALICIIFVVGLLIGLLLIKSNFQPTNNKIYSVDAKLVYAYFKVFNSSVNSGLTYGNLVSYVLILNVTNPSNTTLRLSDIRLDATNIRLFSYWREFSPVDKYNFEANTSRLIAFSQTSGLDRITIEPFKFESFMLSGNIAARFIAKDDNGDGYVLDSFNITMAKISQDEYIYGSFNQSTQVVFQNEQGDISAWTLNYP